MLTSCTKHLQYQWRIFLPLSGTKIKSLAVHKSLAEVFPLYEVVRIKPNEVLNIESIKPINETIYSIQLKT